MRKGISGLCRTLSLLMGLCITIAVIFYPRWIATDTHAVPHGWLVMLLLGMSFAYIHAFGFVPENPRLRILFSPWIAWPLIALAGTIIYSL